MINKDALAITEIILDKCNLSFENNTVSAKKQAQALSKGLVEFTFDIYDAVCQKLSDYDSK